MNCLLYILDVHSRLPIISQNNIPEFHPVWVSLEIDVFGRVAVFIRARSSRSSSLGTSLLGLASAEC